MSYTIGRATKWRNEKGQNPAKGGTSGEPWTSPWGGKFSQKTWSSNLLVRLRLIVFGKSVFFLNCAIRKRRLEIFAGTWKTPLTSLPQSGTRSPKLQFLSKVNKQNVVLGTHIYNSFYIIRYTRGISWSLPIFSIKKTLNSQGNLKKILFNVLTIGF